MPRRAIGVTGELLESAWQAQVVGAARVYGWTRIYHAPNGGAPQKNGRRVVGGQIPEGRGFPDLLLIRGPRLVVAELKTEKGRMGPGQPEWLKAFTVVGRAVADLVDEDPAGAYYPGYEPPSVEAYVWRPSDWETVQRVLGAGRPRHHLAGDEHR
jgi:hypothetical protein